MVSEERRERDARASRRKRLEQDPWIARVGEHRFRGALVELAFGRDLFSSAGVDVGTTRLLRVLEKSRALAPPTHGGPLRVLDLGCGVGSIGLSIAAGAGRLSPPVVPRVVLCDRDRLAVHVARLNAAHAELPAERARVLDAGLDFEPARAAGEAPFDLIVSNVPAKVGREGLRHLLFGAGALLAKGGRVAIVHVAPLTEDVDLLIEEAAERGIELEFEFGSRGAEHQARVLRFPAGLPETERDVLSPYRRESVSSALTVEGLPALEDHVAVHDVPEFDTPHFQTPLLARMLEREWPADDVPVAESILVLNPAHGFLAMFLAGRSPATVALLSRDELELAVALRNVRAFFARHAPDTRVELALPSPAHAWLPAPRLAPGAVGVGDGGAAGSSGYDWILLPVTWKEGQAALVATLRACKDALKEGGAILVACGAAQLQTLLRLAKDVPLSARRARRTNLVGLVVLREPRAEGEDEVEGLEPDDGLEGFEEDELHEDV